MDYVDWAKVLFLSHWQQSEGMTGTNDIKPGLIN